MLNEVTLVCRNIKTLFNFEPPVTDAEIRAAAVQFVRKVSGFAKPSKTNEAAFLAAVDEITAVVSKLLMSFETSAEEPGGGCCQVTRTRGAEVSQVKGTCHS